MLPSLVRLALPEAAIAQFAVPDPVAVPVTLQLIDVPVNVPVPVPLTCSVPKHVAENAPEPVRPDTSVTDHWKFAHVPDVEPAEDTDAHVPSSEVGLFEDGAV